MKKIMIAMGAVMSLALGAWAADSAVVSDGKIVSYMPFTGMPTGSLDPTLADNATGMVGSGVHWECANGASSTEDSVITNLTGDAVDNFLQIDQTETLYRLMNVTQAPSTNEVTATEGIYFASKVQFTASDETNGVSLVTDASDKLLIWLRAADLDDDGDVDDVDGTNLVVTAAGSDGPGDDPVDYVINNVNVQPGTWYTLVVKSTLVSNGNGLEFTIELDGTPLVAEGNVTSFYSLVGGGSAAATITKVGFKGTGAVDDLEFGTIALKQETFFAIGDTPYATFEAALREASSGDVIKMLKDVDRGTDVITIAEDKNVILDLAGHKLSYSGTDWAIGNQGVLAITNSTVAVGSVEAPNAEYCGIKNWGTLNVFGGKYYYANGDTKWSPIIEEGAGVSTIYYVSGNTAEKSDLEPVTSGADAGYWVIEEKSGPVQTEVTAYLSLDTVEATYDATKASPDDYTDVTVVFSNDTAQVTLNLGTDYTITWSADTVTNATSDYICTVTAVEGSAYTFNTVTATLEMLEYVPTWEVTFSTNETTVCTTNVVDGQPLTPDKIPAFTGGVWDVDPTNAVITCATNFNYTISGLNWPEAWSNDSAYAADYTSKLTAWMATNSISSMGTLTEADETAFLLNIAPDEAVDKTIDATAITIDGTTVKITVDQKLGSANGVVYLMYGSTPALGSVKAITFVDGEGVTPSSMTTLEGETATAQFYKVGVGFAVPVTAEP